MRLLVNCPSGESRLLQFDDEATVLELKQELQQLEGIPVVQQVLCYAGSDLKDHLRLVDHQLGEYTLSDEVVLYLSKRRHHPKLIYLSSAPRRAQRVPELVEAGMSMSDVQALLVSRGLAGAFAPGAPVLCKRQDGSAVPLRVDPCMGLTQLEERVAKQEGVEVEALTFMQAQDGAMHVVLWPSAEASRETYPVYVRPVQPQPVMPKKDVATGIPFGKLSDELCVLP